MNSQKFIQDWKVYEDIGIQTVSRLAGRNLY